MAIYKLNELYLIKPEYGIGATAQASGKYKYVRQSDISNNNFPTYVDEGPLLKNDDVLISRAGVNSGDTYIHTMGDGYVFAGFLVRYNFNYYKLLNKYFYYWTKSNSYVNQIKSIANSGSTMPKLNPPIVGILKIDLPSLKQQQEIIDIIAQEEALFLKYSSVVRIDTVDNCKKDMKNLIDIIKPIEDMIDLIDSILKIQNQMFTLQETNSHIKDYITKINTGYAYKKEDKINNGNYKIYTIKNISGISKYE
ncbi:MAG: restriction endonuclease subunit S, partial [Mycoplasmatales bacterium]